MKRTLRVSAVPSALIAGVVATAALTMPPVNAQSGSPPSPASTQPAAGAPPRMSDGHPDLSGVWWAGQDLAVKTQVVRPTDDRIAHDVPRADSFQSLYNPAALAKWKSLGDKDDPTLRCVPVAFAGITRGVSLWGVGVVGQIVQTPAFVILLTETYHGFKLVPTDGRPHSDDAPPSYRGDSVGRWDGDTFVVDTKNFTDDTWVYAEGNASFHTDALHIVERYRRIDARTLQVDATLEDPRVLTAPFHVPTQTLQLAPFDRIFEVSCTPVDDALMNAAAKQNYGRKK